jgi:type II secretory pathway component PulF
LVTILAVFGLGLAIALMVFLPTLRWYCPGIGWPYQLHIQGRVLKMLGVLLEAGKTVPESLAILIRGGSFAPVVTRRLELCQSAAQNGEPLVDCLRHGGLLTRSLAPLLQAAERAHNLPWALAELGEHLTNRATRLIRRAGVAVAPTAIFTIGLLVGGVALGFFLPLVELMGRLSE